MFAQYLSRVMEKHRLGSAEMEEAMELVMEGTVPPVQVAAFLAALRARGETPAEIGGAARVLLRKARTLPARLGLLVDNCGTGGDCAGSFNISTAAAFVAAGGGIPMAKHGNRSVSSRCGSADGGLPLRGNEELAGGSAPENAALIEDVLAGKRGAPRDAVVFNAAAVFLAAGRAKSWKEGTALAAESIDCGRAASVLEKARTFAEPVRRSA